MSCHFILSMNRNKLVNIIIFKHDCAVPGHNDENYETQMTFPLHSIGWPLKLKTNPYCIL